MEARRCVPRSRDAHEAMGQPNDCSELRSRGLSHVEASAMIDAGFVEPIVKELPLEDAIELNQPAQSWLG